MDDLARGWTILVAQMHGHRPGVFIAILISTMTPAMISLWFAMERRKNNGENPDNDLRPKPRARIQGTETRIEGSVKDYRR